MVEGRPKRACADGIDYAGTDQVPGWTVREETLLKNFPFRFVVEDARFEIFEIISKAEYSRSPLFLVRSVSLFSGRFRPPEEDKRRAKTRDERRFVSL